ncbi:MAG TPA: hypothetical protein VGC55_18560 [Dokdonella sp.]
MTPSPVRAGADERRHQRVAFIAAVLLNGVFLAVLDQLMQPGTTVRSRSARPEAADVLRVRLIEPAPTVPAAIVVPAESAQVSSPPAAQTRRSARHAPRVEAAPQELVPTLPAIDADAIAGDAAADALASAPAPLNLYDRTGRVLPPAAQGASDLAVPFPRRPRVAQEGNPFAHRDALPYTPTRLDKYWPSVRDTLGGELVRTATVKRAWRTPWGTQVECAWVLFFGGCGWGPEPRATAEELKQMRADPPMPHVPDAVGAPMTGQ